MSGASKTATAVLILLIAGVAGWFLLFDEGAPDEFAGGADRELAMESGESFGAAGPAKAGGSLGGSRQRSEAGAEQSVVEAGDESERAPIELIGRVVDASGRGVPEAAVRLSARRDFRAMFRNGGPRGGRGGFDRRRMREMFRFQPAGKAVVTDAEGRFRTSASVFREANLEVAVRHDQFAPTVVEKTWRAEAGALDVGDIEVVVGGAIRGRVTDERGIALPGASVQLAGDGGFGGFGRGGRGGRGGGRTSDGVRRAVGGVEADANGWFELARVPAGEHRLRVSRSEYRERTTDSVEVVAGNTVDAGVIELTLGAKLSGIVRTAAGEPIANAEVRVREAPADDGDRGGRGRGRGGRGRFGRGPSATTDEQGRFALEALPLGELIVSAEHPDHIDAELDPIDPKRTPEVDVVMEPRLSLSGRVVDARTGQPITRFAIEAQRAGGWGFGRGGRGGRGGPDRGGRDGGGRRGGDRGAVSVAGRDGAARGRAGTRSASSVGDSSAARQAAEAREARRQQREREQAQRDAQLTARLGASKQVVRDAGPIEVHPDGRFTVNQLEPGRYVLNVIAPDYVGLAAGPFEIEAGKPLPSPNVALQRGAAVSGVVLDSATGQPVAGARVTLALPVEDSRGGGFRMFRGGSAFGTTLQREQTDASGRFSFRPQTPGPLWLQVDAEDFQPYRNQALQLGPTKDLELTVRLGEGARVSGTVRNLEGSAVEYEVSFRRKDGGRETASVDAEGRYEIAGLEAGEYFVNVVKQRDRSSFVSEIASATGSVRPDLIVGAGAVLRYDINAAAGKLATLRGMVTRNGQPGAGLEVRLERVEGSAPPTRAGDQDVARMANRIMDRVLRTRVGSDGRYEIDNAPPGEYWVEVRRGGRGGGGSILRERVTLMLGGPLLRNLTVRTGSLRIAVMTAAGEPAQSGVVRIVKQSEVQDRPVAEWRGQPSYRSGRVRDGEVVLEDVGLGTYRVAGQIDGSNTESSATVALGENRLELRAGETR